MLTETYKNRVILIAEETRDPEPCPHEKPHDVGNCGPRKHYLTVTVNGARQFSHSRFTEEVWVMEQTKRYIDAVDMATERNAQRAAAGAYVPKTDADFANGWRAAA
jgi:hypothetical protein